MLSVKLSVHGHNSPGSIYCQSPCHTQEKPLRILIIKKLTLFLQTQKGLLTRFNTIMTKADIVNEIAQQTGIEKVEVLAVVEAFMGTVKASLIKGEPVYLRGFGSFIVKHRAQKAARNITKKTTINIPAHDVPAFKPAKVFVAALQK